MRPSAPSPATHLTRRRRALVATFVAAALAAGCGVESSSDAADPTIDPKATTTTTEVALPCGDDEDEGTDDEADGDASALPGASVNCSPDPTTTTTEGDPEPTPDPEPEPDPEPSGDEAAYLEALAAGLVDLDEDDLPVTEDQASCIAPEWIDAIGVDALVDAGIAPEDLETFELDRAFAPAIDRDTADAMVATVADCGIDLPGFVRQDGLDEGQTEEEMDCFFDNLPDGAIEDVLAATLDLGDDLGMDDPTILALGEAYEQCVPSAPAGS